ESPAHEHAPARRSPTVPPEVTSFAPPPRRSPGGTARAWKEASNSEARAGRRSRGRSPRECARAARRAGEAAPPGQPRGPPRWSAAAARTRRRRARPRALPAEKCHSEEPPRGARGAARLRKPLATVQLPPAPSPEPRTTAAKERPPTARRARAARWRDLPP